MLEEREANLTEDVLRRQCLRAFYALSSKKAAKLVVAYEPVWAIGTGKTATAQLASDAHSLIRGEAAKAFGQEFANQLRILYGGSVKPENVKAMEQALAKVKGELGQLYPLIIGGEEYGDGPTFDSRPPNASMNTGFSA